MEVTIGRKGRELETFEDVFDNFLSVNKRTKTQIEIEKMTDVLLMKYKRFEKKWKKVLK